MDYLFIYLAKYLYVVIIGIFIVYFFKQEQRNKKQIALLGIIALPITYFIAKLGGFLFYNQRPFVSEKITPLIFHIADNGFPSDHTLLSASISFVVYSFNKKLGLLLLGLTLVVGLSRVYVGIHHIIDIFASIIIAGVVIVIINKYLNKKVIFKKDLQEV